MNSRGWDAVRSPQLLAAAEVGGRGTGSRTKDPVEGSELQLGFVKAVEIRE